MTMKTMSRISMLAVALTMTGAVGCNVARVEPHTPLSRDLPTPAPQAQTASKLPAPPDHATAWGIRHKFQYLYYPDTQVYYAPDRDQYFWLAGETWQTGQTLPARRLIWLDKPVKITMDTQTPYTQHEATLAKYPAPASEPQTSWQSAAVE